MWKRKITAAEYAALTDAQKVMYIAEGDSWIIPLSDYVDPTPLERARDRERDDAKDLRIQLGVADAKITTLEAGTPKDVQTLQRISDEKLAALQTTSDARIGDLRGQLERAYLDQTANQLAGELTAGLNTAGVVLPHIASRLAIDWSGDKAVVKVKKADGTLGETFSPDVAVAIKKEFIANPVFGSIVVKSNASGGGAAGVTSGAASGGAGGGQKKFSEMTGVEKTALYSSSRAEFDRLAAEDKADKAAKRFGPLKPLIRT